MFAGGIAHADGMLPNRAGINFNKFYIEDGRRLRAVDDEAKRLFLNLAHCGVVRFRTLQRFEYEMTITASTGTARPAEIWAGRPAT
jgi:hypothetical protein